MIESPTKQKVVNIVGTLRSLSGRCQKILNLLMYSCDYISLKEIAQKVGVSRRSVYYDICSINDCLDSCKLPTLKVVRGKGILIPEVEKVAIRALGDDTEGSKEYIFLPSERVKIIVCYIIHSKKPIYVEQLMEACQVSRNFQRHTYFAPATTRVQFVAVVRAEDRLHNRRRCYPCSCAVFFVF